MRSIVFASVLLATAGAASSAIADETPPTPVTLPEESEPGPAPSTAPKESAQPASPPVSKAPPAEKPAPLPPAQAAAPPPAVAQPPAAPAVQLQMDQAPSTPHPDSVAHPPGPRGPVNSRFNIGVNVDTVWYTGPSFDFFSERDNATAPGVSLGYAIWMDHPLSIVPELGWSTHNVHQDALFGGSIARTELKSHNAYGGLSIRYGVVSFLEAHVRVAGGASFLNASVQPNMVSPTLEQDVVAPFGTLGGGVTVHSPAGALETRSGGLRSMLAGITFEGGYQLGGGVDLTPQPKEEPGRIPTRYMSLGTLERTGPYFRTSLVVRF